MTRSNAVENSLESEVIGVSVGLNGIRSAVMPTRTFDLSDAETTSSLGLCTDEEDGDEEDGYEGDGYRLVRKRSPSALFGIKSSESSPAKRTDSVETDEKPTEKVIVPDHSAYIWPSQSPAGWTVIYECFKQDKTSFVYLAITFWLAILIFGRQASTSQKACISNSLEFEVVNDNMIYVEKPLCMLPNNKAVIDYSIASITRTHAESSKQLSFNVGKTSHNSAIITVSPSEAWGTVNISSELVVGSSGEYVKKWDIVEFPGKQPKALQYTEVTKDEVLLGLKAAWRFSRDSSERIKDRSAKLLAPAIDSVSSSFTRVEWNKAKSAASVLIDKASRYEHEASAYSKNVIAPFFKREFYKLEENSYILAKRSAELCESGYSAVLDFANGFHESVSERLGTKEQNLKKAKGSANEIYSQIVNMF
ncbi:uncharacterized protein V1516DRAFT_672611 [Lipomyces oligophaga]|uniref:uncharacterized protein n=1 Tax=Lipomyces oligophaga TaxID=45792 RepID=UPI0034CE497B